MKVKKKIHCPLVRHDDSNARASKLETILTSNTGGSSVRLLLDRLRDPVMGEVVAAVITLVTGQLLQGHAAQLGHGHGEQLLVYLGQIITSHAQLLQSSGDGMHPVVFLHLYKA